VPVFLAANLPNETQKAAFTKTKKIVSPAEVKLFLGLGNGAGYSV
jgi:hypothetical protein